MGGHGPAAGRKIWLIVTALALLAACEDPSPRASSIRSIETYQRFQTCESMSPLSTLPKIRTTTATIARKRLTSLPNNGAS